MKKVWVVIPTVNRKKDLKECLESLKKSQTLNCNLQVVVVDNGSKDDTVEEIEKLKPASPAGGLKSKNLVLIKNQRNEGFCRANNQGIEMALKNGADYCFLLNDDCTIEKNAISNFVKTMEDNPGLGILGATVYAASRPKKITTTGEVVNLWFGIGTMVPYRKKESFVLVDRVAGCSMLVRKEVFEKIGLLDERFFAYYEETDFCLRAKKAGFCVAYAPSCQVWHKKEGQDKIILPQTTYYITRNRALFVKRNANTMQFMVFFIIYYFFYFPVRVTYFLLKKRIDLSRALILAMSDSLKENYGKKTMA